MKIKIKIFRNMYQDSVSLMQISAQIGELAGVAQASVAMGTPANLEQLRDAGLDDGVDAGPNDLVVAVRGEAAACDEALSVANERLTSRPADTAGNGERPLVATSIEMATDVEPAVNLALISVPGDYAAAEALKALALGMNVMLFSDNVSLAQEKTIKTLARQKQRLVMGPDCGTAIINGMPLGFANVIRRGPIGVVAASGTGLQEVTCRIDQLGSGVSQALGTGGHDLHEEIGGISMLFGLDALIDDQETRVIVLISKPPARPVAERILARAQSAAKPVVVHFLGAQAQDLALPGITPAATLADAAAIAVALAGDAGLPPASVWLSAADSKSLGEAARALPARRRFIRGVFAGGTFCYESQLLCREQGFAGASNTPVHGNTRLVDIWRSEAHTLVDLGDDDFTRGRPHPMIDPTLRNERILAECRDPQTAVVLFDVVLGYGAAAEPAQELVAFLNEARSEARRDASGKASDANAADFPLLVSHVCGTESDPQCRSHQIGILKEAGVLVAGCNAQAALWSSHIAQLQLQK